MNEQSDILAKDTRKSLNTILDELTAKAYEFMKEGKTGRWTLEFVWDDGWLKSSDFRPGEQRHYGKGQQ